MAKYYGINSIRRNKIVGQPDNVLEMSSKLKLYFEMLNHTLCGYITCLEYQIT